MGMPNLLDAIGSTVALQREGPWFESCPGVFLELGRSSSTCKGSFQVLRLPYTVQTVISISLSKLPLVWTVFVHGCLSCVSL